MLTQTDSILLRGGLTPPHPAPLTPPQAPSRRSGRRHRRLGALSPTSTHPASGSFTSPGRRHCRLGELSPSLRLLWEKLVGSVGKRRGVWEIGEGVWEKGDGVWEKGDGVWEKGEGVWGKEEGVWEKGEVFGKKWRVLG